MYNFRNASQDLHTEMLKEAGNEKMPAKKSKTKISKKWVIFQYYGALA